MRIVYIKVCIDLSRVEYSKHSHYELGIKYKPSYENPAKVSIKKRDKIK